MTGVIFAKTTENTLSSNGTYTDEKQATGKKEILPKLNDSTNHSFISIIGFFFLFLSYMISSLKKRESVH
ncbi:hypothetical protein RV11_GL002161 [Enterococcus phoeniculicola]|nr:hypothetical protein RV11_GL002161 [Enterococcus phoeniculicola]